MKVKLHVYLLKAWAAIYDNLIALKVILLIELELLAPVLNVKVYYYLFSICLFAGI